MKNFGEVEVHISFIELSGRIQWNKLVGELAMDEEDQLEDII